MSLIILKIFSLKRPLKNYINYDGVELHQILIHPTITGHLEVIVMGENGLSASDVALMNRDNGCDGWGGMIWLFAILAMVGGGFNGFGNNGGNANAIQADVNRGFDNQNLQA
jgi:hypothetical protein